MQNHTIELSIIIVSYNTAEHTLSCIESIEKNYTKETASGEFEVIISDNNSQDETITSLKNYKKKSKIKYFTLLENKENLGFSKGNNVGVKNAKGNYVLFLNPDTIVYPKTITEMIGFLQKHPDAGAATCKIENQNGTLDAASHRGFPTPWNALCHFSGLEKLFPKSKIFAGYTQGWKNVDTTHTVDAIVGAFMLVRRNAGESIGWWDEDYFFYGEDLDFCYMLGKKGWKIYYVPSVSILHYGGVSSGIKKHSQHLTNADMQRKVMVQNSRFNAMRLFYKKHYMRIYPKFITWLVFKGIDILHNRNVSKLSS